MAKAVLIQNPESIYDDQPGVAYHFPKRYLGTLNGCVGDWVVFYEGRKGAFGYTGIQRVTRIVQDPERAGHYFAELDFETAFDFVRTVNRADANGIAFEASLRGSDGAPNSGGSNVSAVRKLSDDEFSAIVGEGLRPLDDAEAYPREGPLPLSGGAGFGEKSQSNYSAELEWHRDEVLVSRKVRDARFAELVKWAYGARCAISGLYLRNGRGRPEVQAAHIRPVEHGGPDVVRNGLALSGTLHWMFDRGLISIAEDDTILVSHNKVDRETADRLIRPGGKLFRPSEKRLHPHPEFLRYHRERIFGQLD